MGRVVVWSTFITPNLGLFNAKLIWYELGDKFLSTGKSKLNFSKNPYGNLQGYNMVVSGL